LNYCEHLLSQNKDAFPDTTNSLLLIETDKGSQSISETSSLSYLNLRIKVFEFCTSIGCSKLP